MEIKNTFQAASEILMMDGASNALKAWALGIIIEETDRTARVMASAREKGLGGLTAAQFVTMAHIPDDIQKIKYYRDITKLSLGECVGFVRSHWPR